MNNNPSLVITAAHLTYNRIDRICARYAEVADTPETRNVMMDTVSRQITRKTVMTRLTGTIEFMVVSGTAAPTVAPTVPDGWTSLAQVSVKQNVTSILQADILDERPTISTYLNHKHTSGGNRAVLDYANLSNKPDVATD